MIEDSTVSIQNVASISTALAFGASGVWPTRNAMLAVPPPSLGGGVRGTGEWHCVARCHVEGERFFYVELPDGVSEDGGWVVEDLLGDGAFLDEEAEVLGETRCVVVGGCLAVSGFGNILVAVELKGDDVSFSDIWWSFLFCRRPTLGVDRGPMENGSHADKCISHYGIYV